MEIKFKAGDTFKVPEGCTVLVNQEQNTALIEPIEGKDNCPELPEFGHGWWYDSSNEKIIEGPVQSKSPYIDFVYPNKTFIEAAKAQAFLLYHIELYNNLNEDRIFLIANTVDGVQIKLNQFLKSWCSFSSRDKAENFLKRFKKELEIVKPLL